MNQEQARNLVRQTLTEAFEKTRFRNFVLELLNEFDESKAFASNKTYIKDAFKNHVERFERLGTYTSPDDEKLDVLIVHLTKQSKLERARTAIRNFVADHLQQRDGKNAALVAFVSPTEKQWRFSYVKMEYAAVEKEPNRIGVETKLTPARRFSYIVGEGESCHTAQTRFLDLLQDTDHNPTLAQLEEAFSVDAVTKEFFKKYAELFEEIKAALDRLEKKDATIEKEFAKKHVRTADFAKKLMGQIVFLYFIQKKGWLGVEKGKDWGTGPHDFLRQLAKGEYRKYENFFNDILEPLFYDTLATDRGHEAWCKPFNCRIPFLNGGLFEPVADYDWRKTDIVLPNRLFANDDRIDEFTSGTGLLDMFDRYNFTVNEAEPLEKEVAIDPEMLGKVFENLIEENLRKGLGSYYTPREIVHYMCQESLINYLDTTLNTASESIGREKRKQAEFGDEKSEQTLLTAAARREIVPRGELETFVHLGDQISHYEAVETRYAIKMPKSIEKHARLIDEKLADVTICDPAVGSGAFPVGMMTEIVRARSALTPYFNDVHDRTPYHFKRHAIQNCLYGVDIDPGAVEIAKLRLWLSLVVDEEDVKQIKPLPNLFYKIVTGDSLLAVEKTLFNEKLFRRLEELKPRYFDEPDKDKKDEYKQQIERTIHELTNGKEIFDFEIYFSEVFHRKHGFDVVIANPPYISYYSNTGNTLSESQRRYIVEHFDSVQKPNDRINSMNLFAERGLSLLRQGGHQSLITNKTLAVLPSYIGVRTYLLKNSTIDYLATNLDPFEAIVDCIVIGITKRKPSRNYKFRWFSGQIFESQACDVEQFSRNRKLEFHFPRNQSIIQKAESADGKLDDLVIINRGVNIGGCFDHFLSRTKRSNSYYKYLAGTRSIFRFGYEWKPDRDGFFVFDADKEASLRAEGETLVLGNHDRFLQDRLFIPESGQTLLCAYASERIYSAYGIMVATAKSTKFDLKYACALLNSRLLTFYAIEKEILRKGEKATPHIGVRGLNSIPVWLLPDNQQKPFVRLVNKIISAKEDDPTANTNALEREIDQLVYALYGLTPEEIKIVDGASAKTSGVALRPGE